MSNKNDEKLKQLQDGIFDENGKHLLEDYRPKIKTKISIDFFDETVKIFIVYPKKREIKKIDTNTPQLLDTKRNQLIIRKKFKIANDYKSVTVENTKFKIPTFFNIEMLKKRK